VADVALMCAYRAVAFDLVIGSATAWTSERLADAEGLAAAYEAAGGAELAGWDAHLALAYFKIATIAAGIDFRFRAGATADASHAAAGTAVQPFLELGLARLRP
jgi:aminoglycoside phosphotransferase (APT) family kinase protein